MPATNLRTHRMLLRRGIVASRQNQFAHPGTPNDDSGCRLPANENSEKVILGNILLNNLVFHTVELNLAPTEFSLDSHCRIFKAMARLVARRSPIDLNTLPEELRQS